MSHGQVTCLPGARIPITDRSWGLEGRRLSWWWWGESRSEGPAPGVKVPFTVQLQSCSQQLFPGAHCHFLAGYGHSRVGQLCLRRQAGKRAPPSTLIWGGCKGAVMVWVVPKRWAPRGCHSEQVQECGTCTLGVNYDHKEGAQFRILEGGL